MTTIPLTRGMTAMIDDQDADRVLAHDWRAGMNDRGDLFPISSKQKPTIRLSRFILDLPQGMEIRHANGNRFDCRRENLVVVTRGQGQHLKPRMKPSSGFRGVCHRRQGWGARITRDKRIMFLGYHRTAEDAARRYDVEALQLYDDSARLNFPAV